MIFAISKPLCWETALPTPRLASTYSVAPSADADQNTGMTSADVGHRCPDGAYEWTVERDGDRPLVFRHFAPDVVSHLYPQGSVNEPILLYRGRFTAQADEIARQRACFPAPMPPRLPPTMGRRHSTRYAPGPGQSGRHPRWSYPVAELRLRLWPLR